MDSPILIKKASLFYYSIVFFLGIAFALAFHWSYFIPLLLCFWINKKHLYSAVMVCLIGTFWAFFSYSLPKISQEGIKGSGIVTIDAISFVQSPFQKSILFKGSLKKFKGFKPIPCKIYFNKGKKLPSGKHQLQVTGTLLAKKYPHYVFKIETYQELASTHSFAKTRFAIKEKCRRYVKKFFKESKSQALILSMLTGEIDDRTLALEFNRLGALHLLGISGFQFTILATLLGTLLKSFLHHTTAYAGVIVFLTIYALSLDNAPPIERAWITTSLYYISLLTGRRICALNALGAALLWEVTKDPLLIFHLGFQFSFLCTTAILLTYPSIKSIASSIFPKRTFQDATLMPLTQQQGHILSFICREATILNCSIHLVTLPLLLYHFHKFSWLSIFYNLFLPPIASLIYILLIVGIALDLGAIGGCIHFINNALCKITIKIATHPPALYDFQWRIHDCTMTAAVITITAILYFSFIRSQTKIWLERD
jgi:competence protein ComEC